MFLSKKIYRVVGIALMAILPFIFVSLIQAQQTDQNQTTTIQLVGVIEEIDDTVIVISGMQVDVSTSNVLITDLQVGMTISVSGTLEDGVVMATTIVIIATPTETATPDPEITPEITPEVTTEPPTPAPEVTPEVTEEPTTIPS